MTRRSLFLACVTALAACSSAMAQPEPAAAPAKAARPSGVTLANFDRSVRPQDDFYRYVNGAWLASTEIPADKSNYGTFTKLADDVEVNLKAIVAEAAAAGAAKGTDQQLIGDFYSSFMDEARAVFDRAAVLICAHI